MYQISHLVQLRDILIKKRDAHYKASNYYSINNAHHICVILKDGVPISYGINNYTPNKTFIEHAEAHAFRKLMKHIDKSSKRIKIDIFVVKTNGCNSKPCNRCINQMISYNNLFNIRNIYYTTKDEIIGIRCIKFSKLIHEERHYCSYDKNIRYEMKTHNKITK